MFYLNPGLRCPGPAAWPAAGAMMTECHWCFPIFRRLRRIHLSNQILQHPWGASPAAYACDFRWAADGCRIAVLGCAPQHAARGLLSPCFCASHPGFTPHFRAPPFLHLFLTLWRVARGQLVGFSIFLPPITLIPGMARPLAGQHPAEPLRCAAPWY